MQVPSVIFIDIDRSGFASDRSHKIVLHKTLKRIKDYLDSQPTVLRSGNGYHIIQPLQAHILEKDKRFQNSRRYLGDKFSVSVAFMRFAARFLSASKSDACHNPSFKSCLLRIPGSYNSKCVWSGKESEVKIIQRWDGQRPSIDLLLGSFYTSLIVEQRSKTKGSDWNGD